MSKIKFGNFITYKGSNLATPKKKAVNGNLVFAEIESGADKGYYIFGGVAEGHLVTMDVFNAVKKEVKELIGEGELAMPKHDDGSYYSIVEYVNDRLATLDDYKVKDVVVGATSIAVDGVVTLGDAAQKNVATAIAKDSTDLATAGQVYDAVKGVQDAVDGLNEVVVAQGTGIAVGSTTAEGKTTYTVSVDETIATKTYVDEEIGKLGDVVNFLGVVDQKPTSGTVIIGTAAINAEKGDLVFTSTGEEYIWTGTEWEEIGKVDVDEAVTSAQGSTYVSIDGTGDLAIKTGNITISVVTSAIEEGATGLATAADVYTAVENAKGAATVTGATGYLKVDENKNVVVDAAQVQLGTTNTDTKLATKGYVDDKVAAASEVAAKHSTVTTDTPVYVGVTTSVDATTGGTSYHVNLSDEALKAANHSIETIIVEGETEPATGATTVQGALQDLFESDKVAAEGLTDLNSRLDAHIASTEAHAAENITFAGATGATATNVEAALDELYAKVADAALSGDAANVAYAGTTGVAATNVEAALDDLYAQLATLDGAAVKDVQGDTASYSQVVSSEDDEQVKIVKNVLATVVKTSDIEGYTAATATGLATDAYVQDYVAMSLAWEVLAD